MNAEHEMAGADGLGAEEGKVCCPKGHPVDKEPVRRTAQGADEFYCDHPDCGTFFQQMGYDDWSAEVESESLHLVIKLGTEAMQTRDDVARALRGAADSMQAGISYEGSVHDDNGHKVGAWRYRNDPEQVDDDCFDFTASLRVYADAAEEAREIAEGISDYIEDEVSLPGDVGGSIAAPSLRVPATRPVDY